MNNVNDKEKIKQDLLQDENLKNYFQNKESNKKDNFTDNFNLVKNSYLSELRGDDKEEQLSSIITNLKLTIQQNKSLLANFKSENQLKEFFLRALEFYKAGIDLNPFKQHIYWVPMGSAVGIISPKGLIALLGRLNLIATTQVVYEGDYLEMDLANNTIKHNPSLNSSSKIIGGYCIIKQNNANWLSKENSIVAMELLRLNEIEAVKSSAKTKVVWEKFPEEMIKKSVLKRCIKKIHIEDDAFFSAISFDNNNEFEFDAKKQARLSNINEVNNGIVNIKSLDNNNNEPELPFNKGE